MKKVTVKTKAGLKLSSLIEFPDSESQYPIVVIFPGFTGYKEETHLLDLSRELRGNGIASIRFDYRGFGESEGILENDYLFSNFLDDGRAIHKYIKSHGIFTDIYYAGFSMGGQVAAVLASELDIGALCLVSTPDTIRNTDLGEIWGDTRKPFKKISSKFGKIEIPFAFYEDNAKCDVVDYISDINCPLLVVAGNEDTNVPSTLSKNIFDRAKEPKKYVEVENMDHFYKNDADILKIINSKITTFLIK